MLEALEKDAIRTPDNLELPGVTPDPDDDAVVACAVEGNADVIVSRDAHLLDLRAYQGICIVEPAEFVKELDGR